MEETETRLRERRDKVLRKALARAAVAWLSLLKRARGRIEERRWEAAREDEAKTIQRWWRHKKRVEAAHAYFKRIKRWRDWWNAERVRLRVQKVQQWARREIQIKEAIEQLEGLTRKEELDYYERARISARLMELRIEIAEMRDGDRNS